MTPIDTTERTAIVVHMLLEELHRVLADARNADDILLGMILGTAMFSDEKAGPFRTQRLMEHAPGIVLRTDAHVPDSLALGFVPVLRALGDHLQSLTSVPAVAPAAGAVAAA
jgi:hypothetical protein